MPFAIFEQMRHKYLDDLYVVKITYITYSGALNTWQCLIGTL